MIIAISENLARRKQNIEVRPLSTESAQALAAQARTGSYGIARLIMDAMEVNQHV